MGLMSAIIAIVGRPNVGKSALFNRIVGKRIAIVHDEPGVTRDRISAEAEWNGRSFTLIDTGGIGLMRREKAEDVLSRAALNQVQLAIDSAQLIFLVVNAQEGLVALDEEVARRLRSCGKPVFLLVNKVDDVTKENEVAEFARLGFESVFAVSAIHGRGIQQLLAAAMDLLPVEPESKAAPTQAAEPGAEGAPPMTLAGPLKLAIVGRPNVGKSSLTNALSNSERVIVSPIPGTTRDAVDVPFEVETNGVRQKYILIDTAGLRKRRHRDNTIEFFSVTRAEESIKRCDIVLFVLDAQDGILEQDKKIADLIVQAKKACIVVINKWDLAAPEVAKAQAEEAERIRNKERRDPSAPQKLTTLAEFAEWVQDRLFFLDYAPVIFTSAKEGINLDRLLEAVRYVASQLRQKIPTALLNRVFHDAIEGRQPISAQGHFLKLYYSTQVEMAPPTFLLFVNRNELFSPAYAKYLSDRMRQAFGYEGCPIVLNPRARPKTVASFHKKSKS
jgi:GTPase